MQIGAGTLEIITGSPPKLIIHLQYDPAISLFGIYPKDATSYSRYTCSSIFIAALLIIARK